jgi:predicted flap endonuclease-1-like 5' DNA nuclease
MTRIAEIVGIDAGNAQKLTKANIATTDDLLKICATPKGRKEVATKTGVSETHLLKWSNLADLMRVSGIGPEYSLLLEAAGVDTIQELRTRKADTLASKIKEVNDKKKLAKSVPTTTVVQGWIESAKKLEPKISH